MSRRQFPIFGVERNHPILTRDPRGLFKRGWLGTFEILEPNVALNSLISRPPGSTPGCVRRRCRIRHHPRSHPLANRRCEGGLLRQWREPLPQSARQASPQRGPATLVDAPLRNCATIIAATPHALQKGMYGELPSWSSHSRLCSDSNAGHAHGHRSLCGAGHRLLGSGRLRVVRGDPGIGLTITDAIADGRRR